MTDHRACRNHLATQYLRKVWVHHCVDRVTKFRAVSLNTPRKCRSNRLVYIRVFLPVLQKTIVLQTQTIQSDDGPNAYPYKVARGISTDFSIDQIFNVLFRNFP